MSAQFYVGFGLVVLWNILFWSIFPAKLSMDGVYETFGYFTNWTFAQTGVYFTMELLGYIYSFFATRHDWKLYQLYIRMTLLWAVVGTNFLVFFMVFILMIENWEIMASMTTQDGGTYTLGEVVDLEKVFHTLPTLFLVYFILVTKTEVEESMQPIRDMLCRKDQQHLGWCFAMFQVFSGAVPMIMFQGVLGFNRVYDANVPLIVGVVFMLMIVCAVVLPMYLSIMYPLIRKKTN